MGIQLTGLRNRSPSLPAPSPVHCRCYWRQAGVVEMAPGCTHLRQRSSSGGPDSGGRDSGGLAASFLGGGLDRRCDCSTCSLE